MWSSSWLSVGLSVTVAIAALLFASSTSARTSSGRGLLDRRDSSAVVPRGDVVAISVRGRVMVLTPDGREVRALPGRVGPDGLTEAIQLAPDRRHAWVSVWNVAAETFHMFSIDLATGRLHRLANGVSPTLSPQGTELAYIGISKIGDGDAGETDLVIENVRDGRTQVIPFGIGVPFGSPPDLALSWSPDGQEIAVLADRYRLVNLEKLIARARQLGNRDSDTIYPDWVDSGAKRALFDFGLPDENLVVEVDEAVRHTKPDRWIGNAIKEKKVKLALASVLPSDFDRIDELMALVKARDEYR